MTTDTPTPRTDAAADETDVTDEGCAKFAYVSADFARTIERDLAECRAALRKMLDLFDGKLRCADHETDRECLNRVTAETLTAARALAKEPQSVSTQTECHECDGCGWYEGGAALMTTCHNCKGTGVVAKEPQP